MPDMKALVRDLMAAEEAAGRDGHTGQNHAWIIAATDAIVIEADRRYAEWLATGSLPGYLFTITADHVRDPRATLGQTYYAVAECMGRLRKGDIGKRVFRRGDVIQVENDEQRNLREAFQRAKHAPAPPAYIGHHKHLHR